MSHCLAFAVERYRLVGYLKEALGLDRNVLESACDSLLEFWLDLLRQHGSKRALSQNLKVYQAASAVDSPLRVRLLKKFARYSIARLGLIGLLRTARKKGRAAVADYTREPSEQVDFDLP